MDPLNDKKWFAYLGDHHEGPFSLTEIQEKLSSGALTPQSYVWMDGMGDWKVMTEVSDFAPIIEQSRADGKSKVNLPVPGHKNVTSSGVIQSAIPPDHAEVQVDTKMIRRPKRGADMEQEVTSEHVKSKFSGRSLFLLFLLVVLGGVGFAISQGMFDQFLKIGVGQSIRPYLLKVTEKVPLLAKWISPLPKLEDVASDEYDDLKAAALAPSAPQPTIAVAVSKADMLTPSIYFSGNVPDELGLDVYLVGMGDTLLNQLEFSGKVTARFQMRLAKSTSVNSDGGKPVPRGEYNLYAVESESQPENAKAFLETLPAATVKLPEGFPTGKKLAVIKQVFLGGQKDDTYRQRLKSYHEKLIEKATGELGEAKQFISAISAQFNSTNSQYSSLRAKKNPKLTAKIWAPYHAQWGQFIQQLQQSYARWTPEALQKEYFYGKVFALVREAGIAVVKVHDLQNTALTARSLARTFGATLSEATTQAQLALTSVQTKVEQIEKTPPTPGGLPKRLE